MVKRLAKAPAEVDISGRYVNLTQVFVFDYLQHRFAVYPSTVTTVRTLYSSHATKQENDDE